MKTEMGSEGDYQIMSERLPEVSELIVPQSWNLLELQQGSEKHVDLLGQTETNLELVLTA